MAAAGESFPRRNRRGLIEAMAGGGGSLRRRRVFPGGIAGASLKPPTVAMTFHGGGVFPGGIAGASLKHSPIAESAVGIRSFSPAESPGPH